MSCKGNIILRINRDYYMESAHQQIFFMSCDALKKTKNKEKKKRTSDHSQRVRFFDALQWVNKKRSSTLHSMMFEFHSYWDLHYKVESQGLETRMIVLHSVNLTMYEINIFTSSSLGLCLTWNIYYSEWSNISCFIPWYACFLCQIYGSFATTP